MRLTIVNQFYVPDVSPTAHLSASLAEHRAARGDQVRVLTSYGGYVQPDQRAREAHAVHNPRVHRIWSPQLGKASKLRRIIDYACFYLAAALRLLTLPRQDVIICLTTPPFIALAGLAHKLLHPSTKLVLWNMDCYPEVAERTKVIRPGGLPARLMRWLNRRLFRRVDHLVCLDTAMVELLRPYAGDRHLPATIIPNWERADLFPPPDADPPAWPPAQDLGLNDQFVVLYLGNTGYGHQFDTVLQAARQLQDKPVRFLFVGGGARWHELKQAVADQQLDNVILHGYVPKEQTPAVMALADCALITLRDFALGVMSPSKLHSNLAMSLPIIYVGPSQSNVDDAITRYDCGISLRHGQHQQLVDFINAQLTQPQQLHEMRHRARHAFDDAYCDHRTLPQFDRVIDQVTGKPPSHDDHPIPGREDAKTAASAR